MEKTLADTLVERLIAWEVDTVFGIPGDQVNGVMEALRKARERIRFVHVRHEEVGALAAVGYAKFTGKLGVCLATAGPGAAHLLTASWTRTRIGSRSLRSRVACSATSSAPSRCRACRRRKCSTGSPSTTSA